jgi:glutathione S-transferase
MLKLYYSKGVCSLAVRITLHELNINCAYESVNLKTKHTETGMDYLTINPKGSVPALLLNNNEILTENAVILQYLADTFEPLKFLPPMGNINRYRASWLAKLNFNMKDFPNLLRYFFDMKKRRSVIQALEEEGLEKLYFPSNET